MQILFVCLGNICRSPMAEGILAAQIKTLGLNWKVDSCGTSNYHIAEAPDDRAIATATQFGVDIKGLRARQFQVSDFEIFDHILVMDADNYRNVCALAPNEESLLKVELFLNYLYPNQNRSVQDPWYNDGLFKSVFKELELACNAFIKAKHVQIDSKSILKHK